MTLILLHLLTILSSPHLVVSVSKGDAHSIPNEYELLEELSALQIKQSYWAKVEIVDADPGTYILQGGKPNLQKIHFYDENKTRVAINNHIEIKVDETKSIYYLFYEFIDEKDGDLLTIKFEDKISFIKRTNSERVQQISFHAFLVFPLLISLFLAINTKSVVYVYYSLYILSMMLFFGYQYGILGDILPLVNQIPPIWIWFFAFLQTTFYLLFSSSFLDLKKIDPLSYNLIKAANWLLFGFFLLSISLYLLDIDVQHSPAYKIPFWAVQVFLIIWFVSRIFNHPSKIKIYYLTGFSILIIVVISGQIISFNQNAADFNYLFQIGLVVEVFILALGLSARVNEIQKDKIKAQNDLINQLRVNEELQIKYTDELESQVRSRTMALSKRNEENEILLGEVHHRVKNNLQMITSMLSMQQRRLKESVAKNAISITKNRVKSIGLIHEHLYSHDDFSSINLKEYIEDLVFVLIDSLYRGDQKIKTTLAIQDLKADVDTTIPIGLILNELVTNCIKYAFKDNDDPRLSIDFKLENEELILVVTDNGNGLNVDNDSTGFGNTIISSLLENHQGDISYPKVDKGLTVRILMRDFLIQET